MAGFIQKFFWWCAGADEDVLSSCPKSERTKHAVYGSLVLVPAVLSFFSSSYALSTFISNRNVFITGGIVWALIVFAIDRAIISTFRKGAAIHNDLLSVSFLSRLILALLVGIVVAHPLVMSYFNSSIEGRLDERMRDEIQSINKTYDDKIAPLESKKAELEQDVATIQAQKDADIKQRDSELLTTMGRRRSRRKVGELRSIRQRLIEERDSNIQKINALKPPIDNQIAELQKARQADLQKYKQPRDYLAKENALSDLTATSGVVRWTQRLLIILFVFIDILPITLKVTTKRGAYDSLLESSNQRAIDESKMEDEIHAEILDRVKERQKDRVTEVINARYESPDFSTALDGDIDTILKRSLIRDVTSERATAHIASTQPPVRAEVPLVESGQAVLKKWSDRFREKLKDKGTDVVITLVCLPLQALLLLGYTLYGVSDVWEYVSRDTLLKVIPLLIFNFAMSKLLKPKTD